MASFTIYDTPKTPRISRLAEHLFATLSRSLQDDIIRRTEQAGF